MNIIVLGGGLVGSAIAKDLASDTRYHVTVADNDPAALDALCQGTLARMQADLSDAAILANTIAPFDFVIGALPGFMGFEALKTVIDAGKNVVDISFFPEDPFDLDALAKEKNVTAVVDCGLAPGLGNMLLANVHGQLDETTSFLCFVGGLPVTRRKPYEYAVVFSPVDVIEEYTRPARFIENGALVTRPALSEIEYLEFDGVGTLEAFNSDGLRTLMAYNLPSMKEKTMRYPGHADLMKTLRDTGFFSKDEVDVRGMKIRPLDLTAKLLFPSWKLEEGEEDLSVMRVIIEGVRLGEHVRYTYSLLDRYDRASGTTSMARTTGYTCAVAARTVMDGVFARKGICPPEYLGSEPAAYQALMSGLAHRNIRFIEHIENAPNEI